MTGNKRAAKELEVDQVIAGALEAAKLIGEALKHASTWRWTVDTRPGEL